MTPDQIKADQSHYKALYEWYEENIVRYYEPDWEYYTELLEERLNTAGFELEHDSLAVDASWSQGSGASFEASWDPYVSVGTARDMTPDKWGAWLDAMNNEHYLFTDYMPIFAANAGNLQFSVDITTRPSLYVHSGCMIDRVAEDDLLCGDEEARPHTNYESMPNNLRMGELCHPALRAFDGVDTLTLCETALPMLQDFADDALTYCKSVADDIHTKVQDGISYQSSYEVFEEWMHNTHYDDENRLAEISSDLVFE